MTLKLHLLLDAVFLGGSRGARVTDPNFSVPITDLIRGFPSVVFLNYGINDLAANVPPLQAAIKVFEIAKLIISQVPSAWTGIAATLLSGRRTVHLLFKLPVPILDTSECVNHFIRLIFPEIGP